jgi:hypothetical protein
MEDEVLDIAGSCALRLVFPLVWRAEATDAARFGATRRRGLQPMHGAEEGIPQISLPSPPSGLVVTAALAQAGDPPWASRATWRPFSGLPQVWQSFTTRSAASGRRRLPWMPADGFDTPDL